MGQIDRFLCVSALFLGSAGGAAADVTAEQVWDNWRTFSTVSGQTVTTGAETRSGNRLTITDVTFEIDDEDVSAITRIGEIVFTELGDGRVAVTMVPNYIVSVAAGEDSDEGFAIDIAIAQSGFEAIASGDPGAIGYDFSADTITATIADFEAEEDVALTGTFAVAAVAGSYAVTDADEGRMTGGLSADTATFNLAADGPPSDPGTIRANAALAGISLSTNGTNFEAMQAFNEDMKALPAGFALAVDYRIAATSVDLSADDGRTTFDMAVQTADTEFTLDFNDQALSYNARNGSTALSFSGSDVPFPEIAVGAEETEFGFSMPVAASAEPGPFGTVLRLVGVTLDENIWGIFDPSQTLPRDPATVILDITGQANWLVNLFDEEAISRFSGDAPAELHALDLNALRLSAVGAEVSGSGAFTFDNSDLVTFDGMPRPTGSINLDIVGANALIDRLIALGFLPQEQAMGARMMLGMFARPGAGEDTLTSTIEVREDGAVFANGQRIR